MENLYIVVVILLFLLAISDLIVGISNDAVNFLNSAIGSRVASFKVIMLFAMAGIIVGATFSGGMMEVARKGIFQPQNFYFSEIMLIFLAVMLTDIILLDLFNTFGMPTSTTVSIVFELLGAAVAMSVLKIYTDPNALPIGEYINSGKALAIISGILLSVIVAFSIGALLQYGFRLVFTFEYQNKLKYLGSLWGGIAFTAIIYFILIKGAKDASFMTEETQLWIKSNSIQILSISFISFTLLFWFLHMFFKINPLRIIVLIGTFSLAMAFASNDLVNFIGVPLAGFESFIAWSSSAASPDSFSMEVLSEKIPANGYILLISGLIMVITLWVSRKARSVTETEVDLGRQDEGYEKFGSTPFSRMVVQWVMGTHDSIFKVIPTRIREKITNRFKLKIPVGTPDDQAPSFDMLRASVNIVVASVIISIGTSLKLPLSTTYVTFMVAMGTSLSDRAWGRESAVYRVSGVLSVIGGWFFTAFFAFSAAFLLLIILYYGGLTAIVGMVILSCVFIYKTHILHREREIEKKALEEDDFLPGEITGEKIVKQSKKDIIYYLNQFTNIMDKLFAGLKSNDIKNLKKVYKKFNGHHNKIKLMKDNVSNVIRRLSENSGDTAHYYVQEMDYLREMAHSINFIVRPTFYHFTNSHKPLITEQIKELEALDIEISTLFRKIIHLVESDSFDKMEIIQNKQEIGLIMIDKFKRNQIKRIKSNLVGTRNSILYFNLLSELKSILFYSINLLKSHRDVVLSQKREIIHQE
ncbi:MAG: inorganic phosphate transporter [Bacteroidetes bacterium]|nr:inorganic phosphate transporter [Bacteroidota bacterium]MDA1122310.1 inorganic phosphate transporter [Bacteroidota bacterium]